MKRETQMKAQILLNDKWITIKAPKHVKKAFETYQDCSIVEIVSSVRPRSESTAEEIRTKLNPSKPEHYFTYLTTEVWRRVPEKG